MNRVENYLVGSDPELFIRHSQTNKIISSIGLIPGVKGKAYTPEGMSKGYGLQIDISWLNLMFHQPILKLILSCQ